MIESPAPPQQATGSEQLAATIAAGDYSSCAATVVGYGFMGREYVKALRALRIDCICVCSRSEERLRPLQGLDGVSTVSGGWQRLARRPEPGELAIVATPTELIVPVARHLLATGFTSLLVEKPVSCWPDEIAELDRAASARGADVACAYNRVAYPSLYEVKARTQEEGGITSGSYTFTEFVHQIGPDRFSQYELGRWGIANSLHVMSMAHGLIGLPRTWQSFQAGSGRIVWHPHASIFVGAGVSEAATPFAYHADWGSTGRWSVEAHTAVSSYRLCPLEKAYRRTSPTGDWVELPIATFAPEVKVGVLEEVAAMLQPAVRRLIPLVSLRAAAHLARYGEDVFGYAR